MPRRAKPKAPKPPRPKRSKYNAKKVWIDGIKFDSQREGEYYLLYKEMEAKGEISDLRLQVPFTLLPKITEEYEEIKHLKTKDKVVKKERVIQNATTYKADFVFTKDGEEMVVDVKGRRTKEYELKKKMMFALLGIRITEVK